MDWLHEESVASGKEWGGTWKVQEMEVEMEEEEGEGSMELWQQQEHLYVIGRKSHVVCEDSSPRLVSTETVDVG